MLARRSRFGVYGSRGEWNLDAGGVLTWEEITAARETVRTLSGAVLPDRDAAIPLFAPTGYLALSHHHPSMSVARQMLREAAGDRRGGHRERLCALPVFGTGRGPVGIRAVTPIEACERPDANGAAICFQQFTHKIGSRSPVEETA